MDESEDNMSADDTIMHNRSGTVKVKPKKRSLVERELETSLTARVTSPITHGEGTTTSRYGRSRRLKTDKDFCDTDKAVIKVLKSQQYQVTPVKSTSPAYKMHASNSPVKKEKESPRLLSLEKKLDNQIENIYNANISLSRFGSEEVQKLCTSKFPKVYIRKDLIQTKEKDETVTLIKNMFSPVKSTQKTNSHLSNILERSSEKYNLNGNITKQNGYLDTSSVVKALDFDCSKKRNRGIESKNLPSKSDLFDMEAKCPFQVGDLAWARMGTFPFWPSIITREPGSEMFVKKKLFGKTERDLIHVTFLGDNGRRSWILDSMLRKFQGLAEFEAAREQFTPEAKKKDPRLYAAFFISEKKQVLWRLSIEEAETLQKEPKRLRIELLNELLGKQKINTKSSSKTQKSGKITRTDSDVSLSESLYDTLFSEDDGKNDDADKSRNKPKNKSLDVSDVVTACLDNMAAITGMTKIQKQSHMDRWLQKAKSKTPEKSQYNITVTVERMDKDKQDAVNKGKEKSTKSNNVKQKKNLSRETPTKKPYSFRRSVVESQNLLAFQNEHDYSKIDKVETNSTQTVNTDCGDAVINKDNSVCVIEKVESLSNKLTETNKDTGNEQDLTAIIMQSTANVSKVTDELFDKEISDGEKIERPPIIESPLRSNLSNKLTETNKDTGNEQDLTAIIVQNTANVLKVTDELFDKEMSDGEKIERPPIESPLRLNKVIESNKTSDLQNPITIVVQGTTNTSKATTDKKYEKMEDGEEIEGLAIDIPCSLSNKICETNKTNEIDLQETTAIISQETLKVTDKMSFEEMGDSEVIKNLPSNSPFNKIVESNKTNGSYLQDPTAILIQETDTTCNVADDKKIEDMDNGNTVKVLSNLSTCSISNKMSETNKTNKINLQEPTAILMQETAISSKGTDEKKREEIDVGEEFESPKIDSSWVLSNKLNVTNLTGVNDLQNPIDNTVQEMANTSKVTDENIDEEYDDDEIESPPIDSPVGRHDEDDELIDEIESPAMDSPIGILNLESNSILPSESIEQVKSDLSEKNELRKITANDANLDLDNANNTQAAIADKGSKNNKVELEDLEGARETISVNIKFDKIVTDLNKQNDVNGDLLQINLKNSDKIEKQGEVERKSSIAKDKSANKKGFVMGHVNKTIPCEYIKNSADIFSKFEKNKFNDKFALNEPKHAKKDRRYKERNANNTDVLFVDNVPKIDKIKITEERLPKVLKSGEDNTSNVSDLILQNGLVEVRDGKQFDPETISLSSSSSEISNELLPKITEVVSIAGDVTSLLGRSLQGKKHDFLLESDSESLSSLDDITLSELKMRTENNKQSSLCSSSDNTMDSVKSSDKKLRLVLTDCLLNSKEGNLPKIKNVISTTDVEIEIAGTPIETRKSKSSKQQTRKSKSPPKPKVEVLVNGFHNSKEPSPEAIKTKVQPDTVSLNSSENVALTKRKGKKQEYENMQEPEFIQYLELRQELLMDEHPELTQEEIVLYLYKTWQYEESLKSEHKKNDDIKQSSLVKGVNPEPQKKDKVSRQKKVINIEKVMSKQPKQLTALDDVKPRELPKRKSIKPFYNEEYSDIEEEIEMFEILKPKKPVVKTEIKQEHNNVIQETSNNESVVTDVPKTDVPNTEVPKTEVCDNKETIEIPDKDKIPDEDYYDEEELYFEQLTKPKPNVFRGMAREKVCEICETTSNLVKCKGCNGMFHVDCANKVVEVIEVPAPTRGRKKKKKPRGRKPKSSLDSNDDSHSDDKSQDVNVSEESVSIEDIREPDPIVIDNVDCFEEQLAAKMQEIMETAETVDYDSYASDDGLDWDKTVAGKCEIVDIKLKPKPQPQSTDYSDFKCKDCQAHDIPICFVCKSAVSPKGKIEKRQNCQVAHCQKFYHLECLEHWPQTQFASGEPSRNNKKIDEHFEAITCPRHVCHTCVCDDPRGCKTRFSGDKLARCVRCPATYHSFTKCLPAGSQILSASHIVCPRHYEHRPGKVPCHVNTGWCFICALGGTLICCEYCPTSFHADCLNIEPPEGGYMCEDCETGRLPLYGEMVWVKLGHYRWWPGIILHPSEIPDNIMAVKHSLGEFVVRFFGQYDHYWVNRGRVFPFQEGDSGRLSGQKSKIDEAFTVAMEHAQRAFEILKNVEPNDEESQDIASSLLPPHYVKLKVNKPCGSLYGKKIDIEESSLTQCECNPDEEEPCGPYSHCLNRMLLTECGPTCRAGERCQNRAFEKRQYPKLVPYRTSHRGWGLKTLQEVKAGEFVIEYVGELIDECEFQRRMRRKHEMRDENYYFLTLDKERMIDAGPKGNLARFMNHCCEPNCETQKWTVLGDIRVGLFAIHDIPANTEVTFNYNLECAGIEKKPCMCGTKRCSGYMGAKPKQDEPQPKKTKFPVKRTYKKRKITIDSPSTSKIKPKRPVGRPAKPRELTEIEKDLLIIKNATNGLSSDSECSGRLSIESEKKDAKALKRKRVSFSSEEVIIYNGSSSPSVKRLKLDDEKVNAVGD